MIALLGFLTLRQPRLQFFLSEESRAEETVPRTIEQSRHHSQFRPRKQIEHRSREQMRRRVTEYFETFQSLRQHRFNLYRGAIFLRRTRVSEINLLPISARCESL